MWKGNLMDNTTEIDQKPVTEPTNDTLCILNSRYCFKLDPTNNTVPRLGVGASAIVLNCVDIKSGGDVAVKFVQTYKGNIPLSEIEARERYFDKEIEKTKSLVNDAFLLEYVDDELMCCEQLVSLKSAPGVKAYEIKMIDATDLSAESAEALKILNSHINTQERNSFSDRKWLYHLYKLRTDLRHSLRQNDKHHIKQAQILNGQRFLFTKKYQTTLSRLLIQQPNLILEEKLELLLELIKSLKQIHTMGITHGDLCPDNIMFRLASHKEKKLVQAIREQGISSRYLYELQTVLIDLGRVVKSDMCQHQDQVAVGIPVREANNRVIYAAPELISMSERLPFERYKITYTKGNLILEPMWEFEDISESDEWLGELTSPNGSNNSTEGMSRGRKLGQVFTTGDIIYNSSWGFVIKEAQEEKVILEPDAIYHPDYENNTLNRVDPDKFLEGQGEGGIWEFDDILYVNYQQGIPSDFFAMGMVLVETIVGNELKPGQLRIFSDYCKSIVVGNKSPSEILRETEINMVAEHFNKNGLDDLFEIVLRCVIRGDKTLGYYCSSHADNSPIATIKLLKDYSKIIYRYIAQSSQSDIQEQIISLKEQLERYKKVLGPNIDQTEIFRDIAMTKTKLDDAQQNIKEKDDEMIGLRSCITNANHDLENSHKQVESLSDVVDSLKQTLVDYENDKKILTEEKNQIILDLEESSATANQLAENEKALESNLETRDQEINELQQTKNKQEDEIVSLKTELSEKISMEQSLHITLTKMTEMMNSFTEKFGDDFERNVKAWSSRKNAALLMSEICQILHDKKRDENNEEANTSESQ